MPQDRCALIRKNVRGRHFLTGAISAPTRRLKSRAGTGCSSSGSTPVRVVVAPHPSPPSGRHCFPSSANTCDASALVNENVPASSPGT